MADIKFSALPAVTSLDGTEIVPVVQGGLSRKATIEQIVAPTRATADAALPRAGGTMSGPITLFADPTAPMHPATRQYVDTKVAAGGAGNIPGFDANFPGAMRGIVHADLWPNVTTGNSVSQAARQANYIALHAARDYAMNNGMELRFPKKVFEIEGDGGFTIPPVNGFRVNFAPGTEIVQYATNTPIMTVGEVSNPAGTGYCANVHVLGFPRLRYGVSQEGNTNANGLAIGGAYRCAFQIDVEAIWNGDGWNNAPYRGVYIATQNTSNAFYFENTFEGTIQGAQHSLFFIKSVGTGNRFPRLLLSNGVSSNAKRLSHVALRLSEGNRLDDNEFGRVTIASVAANALIMGSVALNQNFDVLGIENCQGLDWQPCIVNCAIMTMNIGTLRIVNYKLLSTSTPAAGGAGYVFKSFQGGNINIGAVSIIYENTGLTDVPWFLCGLDGDSSGDHMTEVSAALIKISDGDGARRGTFSLDPNMPVAAFPMPSNFTLRNYRYGRVLSRVEPRFRIDSDLTIYGQYEDGVFEFLANPGAARTVTLSKASKASGPGASTEPRVGTKHIIRRRGGTANGNGIVIKNAAGTTLATVTLANTDTVVQYNGTDWVLRA